MKISFLLFLTIILTKTSFGIGGCQVKSIADAYFSSDVAFIAILKENNRKNSKLNQKFAFELIKNFKNLPNDTLVNNSFYGQNFNTGDTVLIFGYNDQNSNITITSSCNGSRIIGTSSNSKYDDIKRKSRNRNLVKLELESVRFYKKLNTSGKYERKSYILLRPIFKNNFPDRFRQGVESITQVKDNAKLSHIKIKINNLGKVVKIKFLNKTPKLVKRKIKEYIQKCKWRVHANRDTKSIFIVETFLYPEEKITFLDF